MRFFLLCFGVNLAAILPLSAQSTVTLDSFQISTDSVELTQSDQMRDCLFASETCETEEFSSQAFTLNDVLNLGVIDREDLSEKSQVDTAQALPSIDLEILFDYNSDVLTAQAVRKLDDLADALMDPRLQNSELLFVGHSDAVGGVAYNIDLSGRRAESVASYVIGRLGLPASRVDAVGMGFAKLKTPHDPESAANRRVQLVLVPMG